MFEQIKAAVERDMETAAEAQYADPVRDALIHNYLLVEVCERLASLQSVMNGSARETSTCKTLQEDQHTGIMLAFMLDSKISQRLTIPGGEPAEDLHITLCYLGNTDEFTPDIGHLKTTVAKFAARELPLSGGSIGGIGRFTPSDSSDNLSPIIAMVNMPGLQEWRRQLASALDSAGVYVASDFDFNPHITLAYTDPDAPMPTQNIEALPLYFNTLWLCIGDERIPYKLGKQEETYYYKIEALDKDGKVLPHETESTPTQSFEAEHDQLTKQDQDESIGTLSEIHEDTGINSDDGSTDTEDASGQDTDPDSTKQKLAETITAIFLGLHPLAYTSAASFLDIYVLPDSDKRDLADAIAKTYIAAQVWSYFHVKETTGVDLSGIAIKHSDALAWARKQVSSIADTLHEQYANFVKTLPDGISRDALTSLSKEWLDNFTEYKTPQIVNVTWGTGADLGTNAALTDILDAATDPTQEPISTDNIRVRVLPETSSSDLCSQYAGNDYGIDEYFSLQVHWPAHPNCPHHIEAYVVDGNSDSVENDEE